MQIYIVYFMNYMIQIKLIFIFLFYYYINSASKYVYKMYNDSYVRKYIMQSYIDFYIKLN